ncbi:hypothetical protein V2G26_003380 [Clonostachys chloroleuca]
MSFQAHFFFSFFPPSNIAYLSTAIKSINPLNKLELKRSDPNMPAKTTKSVGRQEERRKAARDTGIVEANATRCLEDAEPSSDFRAKGRHLLKQAKRFKSLGPKQPAEDSFSNPCESG